MNQVTVVTDTRANLELAKAFAEAKMVPDHFKKSVGDCYIAVNLANRYGMDPWTLMQELYIISGRPMMSGKLATAILNHSLADPLRPVYSGEGDERTITLSGRPEGEAEALSVKLKVKDARTANEQWKKNPDQMLMYAASRTWGRRFAPDILLGIVFDDEEIPTGAPRPNAVSTPPAPAPGLKPTATPPYDAETGEIKPPHALDVHIADGQPETFVEWGARFINHIRTSDTVAEIAAWNECNADKLVEIKESAPKVYARLEAAINAHRIALTAGTDREAS
jgi:hypothetical protein